MNILILSDLHFEFHADNGKEFVSSLAQSLAEDNKQVDVCILAGDIAVGPEIVSAMELFCNSFKKVLYVHGNHEFYNHSRQEVLAWTKQACDKLSNLSWLDNDVVSIDGKRFVGTPLWFKDDPFNDACSNQINCFSKIKDFRSWVYKENDKALKFLNKELEDDDVLITHYLPSYRSVAKEYVGNHLNRFYVCDLSSVLNVVSPKLMIHGHTHSSCDYHLGETRVICNPFGYARYDVNGGFKKICLIEV